MRTISGQFRSWVVAAAGIALTSLAAGQAPAPETSGRADAADHQAPIEERIADLLSRMTIAEKVGQMTQFSGGIATGPDNQQIDPGALAAAGGLGSVLNMVGAERVNALQRRAVEESRLGIPILFALDVIHGYRTVYPVPLAMSATWDPEIVERCARMAAIEASADGLRWTFSPMVDVARDARWGRVTEGSGEDPYLGSVMAAAHVRGYQGEDLAEPTTLLACAKHFAAYGAVEGGREYDAVEISERTLHEVHLPPFEAAVRAGVGTLMSAFNTVNGVPATADRRLVTEILRGEWGFTGFVVSDWTSIAELEAHGVALDGAEAARKALTAGVDMDMVSNLYASRVPDLVASGVISEAMVDAAVTRVLRQKFALGLFEQPYTDESRAAAAMLTREHVELARESAERSFVLLKNDAAREGPVLPIGAGLKVALIGGLADSASEMLGAWSGKGQAEDVVTVRAALAERLGDRLTYVRGVDPLEDSDAGFAGALRAAREADVVVLAVGEARSQSGEASSRTELGLPGRQQELTRAIVETGTPVVMVVFSGRPLALPWEAAHVPAILQAWFPGVQAGPALTRVLLGDVAPAGRLTISVPRSVGQMPLYYNALHTGRPALGREPGTDFFMGYEDELPTPLFPFGWGLTYTEFAYEPTRVGRDSVSCDAIRKGAAISASAVVRNSGSRAGTEVVQAYIGVRGTSVARPVRELKGFQRIALEPGEAREVRFELGWEELAFWSAGLERVVEPSEVSIWIAPHAQGGTPAIFRIEP